MGEEKKEEVLYHKVPSTESVSQGDILFNFPILLPDQSSIEEGQMSFLSFASDIIILSQSCDLVHDKQRNRFPVDPVICAAIFDIGHYSWSLVSETNSGTRPAYYLLNRDKIFLDKSYIIDFSRIYTIPYRLLSDFSSKNGDRIRPISPILEKISQHFGNYFSRIGTEYERHSKDLKEEYTPLREKFEEEQKALKQKQYEEQQRLKQQQKREGK